MSLAPFLYSCDRRFAKGKEIELEVSFVILTLSLADSEEASPFSPSLRTSTYTLRAIIKNSILDGLKKIMSYLRGTSMFIGHGGRSVGKIFFYSSEQKRALVKEAYCGESYPSLEAFSHPFVTFCKLSLKMNFQRYVLSTKL